MRKRIRDRVRAHLARRRPARWTVWEVALVCTLYFGGGLAIVEYGNGWIALGWLILGSLLLLGRKREEAW